MTILTQLVRFWEKKCSENPLYPFRLYGRAAGIKERVALRWPQTVVLSIVPDTIAKGTCRKTIAGTEF